jgi:hypothetical protein
LQFLAHLSDSSIRFFFQLFKLLFVILAQVDIEQICLLNPEKVLDQLLLVKVDFLIVVRVLHCLQIDLLEILSAPSQSIQNLLFLTLDVRVFLSHLKFCGFIFGFVCLLIAHSSQESSIIRFLFLLMLL